MDREEVALVEMVEVPVEDAVDVRVVVGDVSPHGVYADAWKALIALFKSSVVSQRFPLTSVMRPSVEHKNVPTLRSLSLYRLLDHENSRAIVVKTLAVRRQSLRSPDAVERAASEAASRRVTFVHVSVTTPGSHCKTISFKRRVCCRQSSVGFPPGG